MRCLSVLLPLALGVLSCALRPRMCGAPSECGSVANCVAGRCQPNDAGTPGIAEQTDAGPLVRRLVVAPVDVAWVRRGDRANGGSMPALFTLGRQGDGDAILFTRFDVALPKDAKVIEAYVTLARSSVVDADPSPIALHAARIVAPWDSRSISWAAQPALEEVGAPTTRVEPGGRTLVRLDVRGLVERWKLHDRRDHGIAVVAENVSDTGMPFAFLSPRVSPTSAVSGLSQGAGVGALVFGATAERAPPPADSTAELPSPRLELYVK